MPAHALDGLATDVLVVGAGPAGSAAGAALARAGVSVVVLDRAEFPRKKTCGDAVPNAALDVIEQLGAGDALRARPSALVRGAVAVLPDGARIPRSYGARPGRIITRLDLDDVLRRQVETNGGRVVERANVRQLDVERGRIVGARGDGFVVRARIVIAADGPGSVAWTALSAKPPRGAGLAISATAYARNLKPAIESEVSEHYFDTALPAGYGWIFPEVEGLANVGVYQRADRYHAASRPLRALLDDFVARHPERFEGATFEGPVRSWQLPLATPRTLRAMAGLLVTGDAARPIDPLTGEGIWHALASGMLAAESATEALAHGGLDLAAAKSYRRRLAHRVIWPTAARRLIQDAMDVVVRTGLYRTAAMRALLTRAYGESGLEISKSVG